uniref:Uncharacterized protein n=1 Tax=Arundo donax TaxID=35708 RepID=A0A0A9G288_ARUDO
MAVHIHTHYVLIPQQTPLIFHV